MTQHPDDLPSPDQTNAAAQEQRTRLMTKLNCLIAVLEVAITKIGRNLETPDADRDRLQRVRANLENTLAICNRAKRTLGRSLDERPGRPTRRRSPTNTEGMGYRDYVELSSIDEYRKFKSLPPIESKDLAKLDLDDLARQLGDL
jgi:hypothetical protein